MLGPGASGPSSTIFCLPIAPQRGSTVASSVSLAQQCTRLRGPDRVTDRRIRRIGVPIRVGHGVEVIQITKELVEAVHAGQIFVQIAEMVLAELSGRVAHSFKRGGDGRACAGSPTSAPA